MLFIEKVKIKGKVYKLRDWVTVAFCIIQLLIGFFLFYGLLWVAAAITFIFDPSANY